MPTKVLYGEIASQPTNVTLDGCRIIMVYVLVKIDDRYQKFYYFEDVIYEPGIVHTPSELYSNILVSSIGDKVRIGVLSPSDNTRRIYHFVNDTRSLGSLDE